MKPGQAPAAYAVCRLCGLDCATNPNLGEHLSGAHKMSRAVYRHLGQPAAPPRVRRLRSGLLIQEHPHA